MKTNGIEKRNEEQSHMTFSGQSPGGNIGKQYVHERIPLEQVRADAALQSRAELNTEVVEEYAALVKAGHEFPPVVVFKNADGFLLADGFHRFAAHQAAESSNIQAQVREGSRTDAILFSVGANIQHGLKRTNEDKRRSVQLVLAQPECKDWSSNRIATLCGVSDKLVEDVRSASSKNSESPTTRKSLRNGQVVLTDTTNIGKRKPVEAELVQKSFGEVVAATEHLLEQIEHFKRDYRAGDLQEVVKTASKTFSTFCRLAARYKDQGAEGNEAV